MIDIFQRDHALTAARRLRKTEVHRLLARERRFDFFHPVNLLQFALRLRRLARLGPKAIGECLERRDLFLLILVGRELLLCARRLLFDVTVPVAAIPNESSMRDLDNRTDQLVQKLAVVRDHQDRAGIIFQIILEPDQRLEVEVIGRFIEQQQIRFLDKQTGEMRTHHPAAAHRFQRSIEIRFAKRQSVQNAFRFRFDFPIGVFGDFSARQLQHRLLTGWRVFLRQKSGRGRFLQ